MGKTHHFSRKLEREQHATEQPSLGSQDRLPREHQKPELSGRNHSISLLKGFDGRALLVMIEIPHDPAYQDYGYIYYVHIHVLYVCMYVCMSVCLSVCLSRLSVCMFVRTYVRMYVYMCMYVV